ncbi:MAG: BON domain-containing protein [Pseudomonadota bacterium]
MRTLGVTIVFFALLAALTAYAIQTVPNKIQLSIAADIENQFNQNDLNEVDVAVEGRDVRLAGVVATQAKLDSAIEIARHRPGVRLVMNEIKIEKVPRAVVEPLPETFEVLPETDLQTE